MRFRAAHFACLMLLLSSLGVAEASALRSSTLARNCMAMLLQHGTTQQQDDAGAASALPRSRAEAPVAVISALADARAVSSPAMQATQVHTVTGLRR